jgi:hypothetical protein
MKIIQDVASVLHIPVECARTLLIHFRYGGASNGCWGRGLCDVARVRGETAPASDVECFSLASHAGGTRSSCSTSTTWTRLRSRRRRGCVARLPHAGVHAFLPPSAVVWPNSPSRRCCCLQIEHLGVSSSNAAPIDCTICFTDGVGVGDAYGLGCGHIFCKACWSGYLSTAVAGSCAPSLSLCAFFMRAFFMRACSAVCVVRRCVHVCWFVCDSCACRGRRAVHLRAVPV